MAPPDYSLPRHERAVRALRTPDPSMANVPNTVRQAMADVIEEQRAAIAGLLAAGNALANAAWKDLCLNRDEEGGGFWSLETEAAISLWRAKASEEGQS